MMKSEVYKILAKPIVPNGITPWAREIFLVKTAFLRKSYSIMTQGRGGGAGTSYVFLFLFLLCGVMSADAATHYVSAASLNPQPPYTSWATAADNIQDAVEAAGENDTVEVGRGLYNTGGFFDGVRLTRVHIPSHITVRSVEGAMFTTIEGAEASSGGNGPDAFSCAYVGTNAVLQGFTISRGYSLDSGDSIKHRSGAGVWCEVSGVVSNCMFMNNSADEYGGGAYGGSLYVCTFFRNSATNSGGGAAYSKLYYCTFNENDAIEAGGAYESILYNCTFSENTASFAGGAGAFCTMNNCKLSKNYAMTGIGGGVYFGTHNNCTFSDNAAGRGGGAYGGEYNDCVFRDNSAEYDGGGAYLGDALRCRFSGCHAQWDGGGAARSRLRNCILTANTAGQDGGGTFDCNVYNCTISGNTAAVDGGGAADCNLHNSIIWGNTSPLSANWNNGVYSYCCSLPLPPGQGNIFADPKFVSASDLRLRKDSPCINAGNNTDAAIPYDLAGVYRIFNKIVDMGAYEWSSGSAVIPAVNLLLLGRK